MIFAKLNFTEVEAHSILVELRSILRYARACAHATICTLFICILWYARGTRKFPGAIDSAYKVEVICMEIYRSTASDFGRRAI